MSENPQEFWFVNGDKRINLPFTSWFDQIAIGLQNRDCEWSVKRKRDLSNMRFPLQNPLSEINLKLIDNDFGNWMILSSLQMGICYFVARSHRTL
jgi:hypothetical protein